MSESYNRGISGEGMAVQPLRLFYAKLSPLIWDVLLAHAKNAEQMQFIFYVSKLSYL
ncbi:hypothetical protein N9K49_02080 [Flavobacteriaceae bacterium]|nr:hypothetical protein [Flavobacteriaceae bacterium]